MHLKKVEIQGFKSFAKKTFLEFEPGITAVVGPNGSGKSNIADSLRWVFGEQSMKLLRGKVAADVIFAGSDQKSRLGAAEVMAYFDNRDGKMATPYDEVMIGRRVYRDGNSEYVLNGNVVRLLDIEELLFKSGFGNTSYWVIGQGMIDQLILRGPGAIKELVEEAAGITPYYQKRERTLRKLEQTESNLEQARALITEIEPRLRSLRRQAKRLEQREDIEKELKEFQIQYYGQIIGGLEHQLGELNQKLEAYDKQITDVNKEISDLSKSADQQEKDSKERSESYRKVKTDLDVLQKERLKLLEEMANIRGRLKAEEAHARKNVSIDIEKLKSKFKAAYDRLLNLFKNFEAAEAARVEQMFSEVSQIFEGAESAKNIEHVLADLKKEETRLNTDLENLFGRISKLEQDFVAYNKEEEDVKQQLFVKERLLRNKQEMVVKTSEAKNQLAVEQARLATRKDSYEQEASSALGSEFRKLLPGHRLNHPLSDLQEKIGKLKKQLEMIGGVDELLVQEYKETEERYTHLTTQSEDLEKGIKDLKTVIAELDEVIKKEFHEAFTKISEKFAEYFRMLFSGGKATMTLVRESPLISPPASIGGDEEGVEEAEQLEKKPAGKLEIVGIEIRATPPGKKLAGISALSGGERALTSIALLSSILSMNPSPFVVLDEVDAALDEANSIRFGKIIGTLAHKTQFITITHNRETMRQSHTLYGVTMGDDSVSKVISLKLEQAAVYSTKNK
ncbi:MAG: hypothetical protein A3K05_01915 [Candidatus Doudnabacteria bacterium RIFCSPHIGHO2_01_48_18]|nr:MAG: hypothetical protein A3K05_01915 [Candidatus Doudnabacteria bacterium RIFCSPHIGHO2_01_48_18]